MILQLLTGIHNLTTLLFGIFISAFFLGVKPIMKNFGKLLLFALVDVFFYWNINLFTGTAFANQLYPVLVQLISLRLNMGYIGVYMLMMEIRFLLILLS